MALIDNTYFFGQLLVGQKSQPTVDSELQWFIDLHEPKLLTELLGYELYKNLKAGLQETSVDAKWTDLLYGKEYTNAAGKLTKWSGLLQVTSALNPGTYIPADIEIPITGALIDAVTYTNSFLVGKSFRVVQRGFGPLGSKATINSNGFTLNTRVFEVGDTYFIQFTAPVALPTPATVIAGSAKQSPIANYVFYFYSRNQATSATGTGEKQLSAQNAINASAISKQTEAWNQMVDWNRELYDFLEFHLTTYPEWDSCYTKEIYSYKNPFGF